MTFKRLEPLRELMALQERMNRLLSETLSDREEDLTDRADWVPAVDIFETGETLVMKLEVPEAQRDAFTVEIENHVLRISGERRTDPSIKPEQYHRVERGYGRFSRSFKLPGEFDEKSVDARYHDGILTISVPRRKPVSARKVEIR